MHRYSFLRYFIRSVQIMFTEFCVTNMHINDYGQKKKNKETRRNDENNLQVTKPKN